ncbi:MAG: fibronectin type III domain-containing protein [Oscillospiraceae bacterium]
MNIRKFAAFILAAAMFLGISAIPTAEESGISISASAASKLSAPSGIKAAAGTDKITLTWDKVNGADAYRVYMYDSYSKKFKKIKTTSETKATVTGLLSEESYCFMISAVKKNGSSYISGEYSKQFKVTTKSIGSKNLVLTEYYEPNMEKGSDVDCFFEYDNEGRIASVKSCYLGYPERQDYEFKADISYVRGDWQIEYSENKIMMTGKIGDNTTIKRTTTYNNNFDIVSIESTSDDEDYANITTISYSYDKNNNLISETYIKKYTSSFYEKGSFVKETTTYKYDSANNLISKNYVQKYKLDNESGTSSSSETYKYDKKNNLIFEKEVTVSKSGSKSETSYTYTYDENNRLIKSTDQYGNVTTNSYDKNNRLIKSVNQNGDVTSYSYDSSGNLIRKFTEYKNHDYGQVSEERTYNYYKNGKMKHYTYSTTENDGETYTWSKPYYVYKTINKEIDEKTEILNSIVSSYFI